MSFVLDEAPQMTDGFVSRKGKSQHKKGLILDLDVGRRTGALGIIPIAEEAPMAIQKKLPPRKGREKVLTYELPSRHWQ